MCRGYGRYTEGAADSQCCGGEEHRLPAAPQKVSEFINCLLLAASQRLREAGRQRDFRCSPTGSTSRLKHAAFQTHSLRRGEPPPCAGDARAISRTPCVGPRGYPSKAMFESPLAPYTETGEKGYQGDETRKRRIFQAGFLRDNLTGRFLKADHGPPPCRCKAVRLCIPHHIGNRCCYAEPSPIGSRNSCLPCGRHSRGCNLLAITRAKILLIDIDRTFDPWLETLQQFDEAYPEVPKVVLTGRGPDTGL